MNDPKPQEISTLRQIIVTSGAAGRLSAAKRWIAALPRDGEALIVGPHSHAADNLVQSEVARAGTRFGLHRFTLTRLAARLAAPELARRGAAPGTPLSLAAVVTRAIHHQLESGEAGRFTDICGRPGFPHAVVRTFEELRGAGVSADDLRTRGLFEQDLAAIVDRTERELRELRFADRAEIFQLARAAIEQRESPLAVLPALLLDLPLEEKLERDLVGALAAAAPRVLAIAPEGDAATIARLEETLGTRSQRLENEAPPCSLRSLQESLFEERSTRPRPGDESVTLASWPGEARECIEIARRLQTEALKGIPFDRMAVFLRSPMIYRAHIEESLRRAGVPAFFARGTTRPDPAGRATLALLSCAAEGLSARRFAEYLSLAQVPEAARSPEDSWAPPQHELMPAVATPPEGNADGESANEEYDPEAPILEGTLRAPWRWERLLVDASVIGGRDRWRRRLDGLAQEIALRRRAVPEGDGRAIGLERVAADLEHLRGFVLPLIDRLADLPKEAPWSEWLEHLRGLTVAAIRHPTAVLNVLGELEPLGPVGPVDLIMVQHVLGPRLRDLNAPSESRPHGAVFVAPIEMARGLEFDAVFVPGLAEKLFPPRIVEDPLLPDEAREEIGASELGTQESRVARERLALRIAVGAARRHVVLSWPRIDVESARARVPSFYVLEAVRAAEGRLPGFDELRRRSEAGGHSRLGWPAPERPEEAIDDSEYDLAVLARLKDSDPATSGGAAHYLLAANPHLARALRARGRRWLRRWTIADGLVDPGADSEAMAALARHRMGSRSFSPTALEHFSACPYRFFLQAVHRLQPREEAEALETIDPLTRGALFHEAQFGVLTALRDGGYLPLDPERLEVARELLDDVVNRVAAEYEERLAPAIPRVWTDGVNAIRADLREWLARAARDARGWIPYRFELSFGLAERARATADSASVPDPVAVLDGALLRGSIDLVERRREGMLRVTDHKTGKARVPEGAVVWGGKALQPMLYALAAEALLHEPVESGRLYYCTADGDFTERVIPLDDVSRGHVRSALGVVARALEEGFLPAAPDKDACRWCDYRRVCGPHEEHRTARKPTDRLTDLRSLRSLP